MDPAVRRAAAREARPAGAEAHGRPDRPGARRDLRRLPPMSRFERYLTLWVAVCIANGVALGRLLPRFFEAVGSLELAKVNLPVALLVWLMIVPMLAKIDFAALGQVRKHWRGDRK